MLLNGTSTTTLVTVTVRRGEEGRKEEPCEEILLTQDQMTEEQADYWSRNKHQLTGVLDVLLGRQHHTSLGFTCSAWRSGEALRWTTAQCFDVSVNKDHLLRVHHGGRV